MGLAGSRGSRLAAIVFLSLLFLTNVYRSFTQSVVCDEAYSWQLYLSRPLSAVFFDFTAANHLVATLLSWISFRILPWPVFAMRAPVVLAGAWYFVNVFRLCDRVFGGRVRFLLGVGLLTLNPLILDFLVAARGYGMALAGMSYSVLALVNYLSFGRNDRDIYKACSGLSFAVGTSLTFLPPSAGLILIFLALCAGTSTPPCHSRGDSDHRRASVLLSISARLAGPFLVSVALLYFVFPLHKAHGVDFYWGVRTWEESLLDFVRVSFGHNLYIGSPHGLSVGYRVWITLMTALTAAVILLVLARIVHSIGRLRARGVRPFHLPKTYSF